MKVSILIAPLLVIAVFLISCSAPKVTSTASPIQHELWDSLLQKYVDENGLVDYQGFRNDSIQLKNYLTLLQQHPPSMTMWSDAQQMAYWINAYNAFTIDLIIRHYPVESIKDIKSGVPFVNSVWDIKFIELGGVELDLNNIEHGILRQEFNDPRIHFALVCASLSCPKLRNQAFTAEGLEQQLEQAAQDFFADPFRNKISETPIQLSKILQWYWLDFKDQYDGRYALVNRYTELELTEEDEVEFLDYDWSLNEQTDTKQAHFK